jgi:hypothetical protein
LDGDGTSSNGGTGPGGSSGGGGPGSHGDGGFDDGSIGSQDGSPGGPGGDGASVDGCGPLNTSQNCGACGHDCGGGACLNGVCQPSMLVSNEMFPNTIAADNAKVYWGNATDVDYGTPPASIVLRSMNHLGGSPGTIQTLRPGFPTSLHRDGQYLYFYRSIPWSIQGQPYEGTVFRTCADGSCPIQNLSGSVENQPWQIAIDSTKIFFPYSFTGGISQISKNGGAIAQSGSISGFYYTALAVDETYLYALAIPNLTHQLTDKPKLVRYLKDPGSPPEVLMTGVVETGNIATDANYIYLSNTYALYRLAKSGPNALKPEILSNAPVTSFLIDDKRIYWVEFTDVWNNVPSSVHWMNKDGTKPQSIDLSVNIAQYTGLAQNDTGIFWIVSLAPLQPPIPPRGGIMRLTKPL